jgi:hypothetical protein
MHIHSYVHTYTHMYAIGSLSGAGLRSLTATRGQSSSCSSKLYYFFYRMIRLLLRHSDRISHLIPFAQRECRLLYDICTTCIADRQVRTVAGISFTLKVYYVMDKKQPLPMMQVLTSVLRLVTGLRIDRRYNGAPPPPHERGCDVIVAQLRIAGY